MSENTNKKINFDIISSGSSGNCVILNESIALDMGIPFKKIEPYLNKIKLIFISHEHQDHLKMSTLIKIHKLRPTIRFAVGFWLKDKLVEYGINQSNIDVLRHNMTYDYKLFKICPFILIHDVFNYGLKLFINNKKILYAVDTNSIEHVKAENYDLYLIEANYDETKLQENINFDKENGFFSYGDRVKSTHLSLQQSSKFLLENMGDNSEYKFLHCSKRNF